MCATHSKDKTKATPHPRSSKEEYSIFKQKGRTRWGGGGYKKPIIQHIVTKGLPLPSLLHSQQKWQQSIHRSNATLETQTRKQKNVLGDDEVRIEGTRERDTGKARGKQPRQPCRVARAVQ
jgi:hypothetical protein